jgi:hypothetical protein
MSLAQDLVPFYSFVLIATSTAPSGVDGFSGLKTLHRAPQTPTTRRLATEAKPKHRTLARAQLAAFPHSNRGHQSRLVCDCDMPE